jgi:hypothetical protein
VVAADGSGDYTSIGAAVDNASEGDVIEVRPGTYREAVTVEKNVTLRAPQGATLNGSSSSYLVAGITVPNGSDVEPTIEGFTIREYPYGVWAVGSAGDFRLANLTLRTDGGVVAAGATGDWTLAGSTVRPARFSGVVAVNATGQWAIQNTTIADSPAYGILATNATNAWTLRDSRLDRNLMGIYAAGAGDLPAAGGDWTVRNTTIANSSFDGINATGTTGAWKVTDSRLAGNAGSAIDATGAAIEGDATYNYWGASDGPSGDFDGSGDAAVGNLRVKPYYTDANRTTLSGGSTTCIEDAVSGTDGTISLTEIQRAIDRWAGGEAVPDTGGETISLSRIQSLIDAWAEGRTVAC